MPPIVIAASLPITWAATWITTSGITGLTLPGMIEEPFCSSGRRSSASPRARAGAHQRQVVGDLVERDGVDLQRAGQLDQRVAVALRLEGVERRGDRQAGVGGELLAHLGGELRVGVQAGAGGGAAERDLADPPQRRLDPLDAEPHLRRVAAELLAEGHRDRVHQVGAARLDDVGEAPSPSPQARPRAPPIAGSRSWVTSSSAARWTALREDVVGRLAHVDVVVRVAPRRRRGWRSPRWRSCSTRCPSRSGRRRSGTGRRVRPRRPPCRRRRSARRGRRRACPSAPLASAAADLIRPSQRTTGTGTRSPETGKLSTALVVSPPQSCSPAVVSASTLKLILRKSFGDDQGYCAAPAGGLLAQRSAVVAAGGEALFVGGEEGGGERFAVGGEAGGDGEAAQQLGVDAFGVGATAGDCARSGSRARLPPGHRPRPARRRSAWSRRRARLRRGRPVRLLRRRR